MGVAMKTMNRMTAFAIASVLAGGAVSATANGCPAQSAHYVLDGDANIALGFKKITKSDGWISNLALFVESNASHKKIWFLFDRGSARLIALISTLDVEAAGWHPPDPDGGVRPYGDTQYLSAGSDYKFYPDNIPKDGDRAPEKILLPYLPELLFESGLSPKTVDHAFFSLKSCGEK